MEQLFSKQTVSGSEDFKVLQSYFCVLVRAINLFIPDLSAGTLKLKSY